MIKYKKMKNDRKEKKKNERITKFNQLMQKLL